MNLKKSKALRIGIIGAGFSGVSLVANLNRLTQRPLEIYLFEKTGNFGTGDAYRTPFPYHLLNIRAENMSAFENEATHFVNWINRNRALYEYLDQTKPLTDQFVPRLCYGHYLKHLLKTVSDDLSQCVKLMFESAEVIDVLQKENFREVVLKGGKTIEVDKVVFALGNLAPANFPFPVENINCIPNPWDYTAPTQIKRDESVLIVGTGLSMIDVVLTLHHHEHQGKIYAISRHGLMPLPHRETAAPSYQLQDDLSTELRALTKQLRLTIKNHLDEGGDWRSVMNAYRVLVPEIWSKARVLDKERFLRHVLPYWNIHRHRVHSKISSLLTEKLTHQQLCVMSGRILSVKNEIATIQMRKTHEVKKIKTHWVINCMGPSLNTKSTKDPLVTSLLKRGIATIDPLRLGLITNHVGALQDESGNVSSMFYTLGPLRKGMVWESSAVPGIRKQSLSLATHLLFGE